MANLNRTLLGTSHEISLKLMDITDDPSAKISKVFKTIVSFEEEDPVVKKEKEVLPEVKESDLSFYVEDISSDGLVNVFTKSSIIIPEESIEEMNGRIHEIIKLSIDISSEIEQHGFWYEFVEFYENGFDLKVHFEDPLKVSKNEKGDFLFVTILNKSRYLFA
jgi:hypothetical protein